MSEQHSDKEAQDSVRSSIDTMAGILGLSVTNTSGLKALSQAVGYKRVRVGNTECVIPLGGSEMSPPTQRYVEGTARLLCDHEILELCKTREFISPYVDTLVRRDNDLPVISYGVSSYGYDVRLADEFKIFSNTTQGAVAYVDPKNFDESVYVDHKGPYVIIPAGGFVLACTAEYFKIPANVTGIVLGKSTYARIGVNCLATPLEAGWEGQLVLEFANTSPMPVKMYANEGCAQILFFTGTPCKTSYSTRGGKYQGQKGITLPRA